MLLGFFLICVLSSCSVANQHVEAHDPKELISQLIEKIQLKLHSVLEQYQLNGKISEYEAVEIYHDTTALLSEMVRLVLRSMDGEKISLDGVIHSASKILHNVHSQSADSEENLTVGKLEEQIQEYLGLHLSSSSYAGSPLSDMKLWYASRLFIVGVKEAIHAASRRNNDTTDQISSAVIHMATAILRILQSLDINISSLSESPRGTRGNVALSEMEKGISSLLDAFSPLAGLNRDEMAYIKFKSHRLLTDLRDVRDGNISIKSGIELLTNDTLDVIEHFVPPTDSTNLKESSVSPAVRLERVMRKLLLDYGPAELYPLIGAEVISPSQLLSVGYGLLKSTAEKINKLLEHPDKIIRDLEKVKSLGHKYIPVLGERLQFGEEITKFLVEELDQLAEDVELLVAADGTRFTNVEKLIDDTLYAADTLGLGVKAEKGGSRSVLLQLFFAKFEKFLENLVTHMAPYLNLPSGEMIAINHQINALRNHVKNMMSGHASTMTSVGNLFFDTARIIIRIIKLAYSRQVNAEDPDSFQHVFKSK